MTLSAAGIRAFTGLDTDEVAITLLYITHADLATPIKVCDNTDDFVLNIPGDPVLSGTYTAYPFNISHIGDRDSPGSARLTIANVDRMISEAISAITSPPTVHIFIVLASVVDNFEVEWRNLEMRNIRWNALQVEADLFQRFIDDEPASHMRVTPRHFPGLF